MQAIILAGGKATRLRPYTAVLPKPLMPVGEMPILEVVIRQLARAGFTRVVLAVGHLSGLLEAFFGDGSKWGVSIEYSREEEPLGTAGPIRLLEDAGRLDDKFLVMNGDVLTNLDYGRFMSDHSESGATLTIATYERDVNITLGVIELDEANQLRDYIEKPTYHFKVSMGVYGFTRQALEVVAPGEFMDFPEVVKALMKRGDKVQGHPFDGYWLDIGRPEDYQQAVEEFEQLKGEFLGDDA